ncbi:MAG: tRNA threonylcarbamoyladenosine dehydratase [Bacilli bacterium]|nr:tRNA threonylcarbamoyladenosine dehydratase [Bacilli bacterium]
MEKFKRLEKLVGKEAINSLNEKTVLVLGIGGVGGYTVEALVRSNIGKIIIVDGDKVEKSNINRQIIALEKTIGKKKTDVMKKRIKEINSNCEVITISEFITKDNIDLLFKEKIDYLVDACDTIKTKELVIKKCIERKIKIISSMGTAKKMDPSKLEITDIYKTINDPIARIIRKFAKEEKIKHLTVLSSKELPKDINDLGSNAFVPPTAGLLIASYIVNDIVNSVK